jgi:molybdopterin converting factor small subunit
MTFVLSGNLLRFSSFRKEIFISAPTVAEGIAKLVSGLPLLRPVLLDGAGQFRKVHRLFVNQDQVTNDDLARPVDDDDEVMILTAIAGG